MTPRSPSPRSTSKCSNSKRGHICRRWSLSMMCASRTFSTRYLHHCHNITFLFFTFTIKCTLSFQTVKLEEMEKKAGNAEGDVSSLRSIHFCITIVNCQLPLSILHFAICICILCWAWGMSAPRGRFTSSTWIEVIVFTSIRLIFPLNNRSHSYLQKKKKSTYLLC